MKIGIVGLGLIGGSMAKAICRVGGHRVIGFDRAEAVLAEALKMQAIGEVGTEEQISTLDMILLALYPKDSIAFIEQHAHCISKECIVCDFGGVKEIVCQRLNAIAKQYGFHFIGGHPMAGRELSGFLAAQETLFDGASMILTPEEAEMPAADHLAQFFKTLGFAKIVYTTPENHDRMIAFTSQLAHVVSSAYIKSPEATRHDGYSAGSYRDLTRVARLNEDMWTELFLENRVPLVCEIDTIIHHLTEYRDAIADNKAERLHDLLRDGRIRKEQIDKTLV